MLIAVLECGRGPLLQIKAEHLEMLKAHAIMLHCQRKITHTLTHSHIHTRTHSHTHTLTPTLSLSLSLSLTVFLERITIA